MDKIENPPPIRCRLSNCVITGDISTTGKNSSVALAVRTHLMTFLKNDERFRHSEENVNLCYILTVVELNCLLELGKPVRRVNDYIGERKSCLCFYLCLNIATLIKLFVKIVFFCSRKYHKQPWPVNDPHTINQW